MCLEFVLPFPSSGCILRNLIEFDGCLYVLVMWECENCQENGDESFEQLQELFKEMFQGDIESLGSSSQTTSSCSTSSSSYASYCDSSSSSTNKRRSFEMSYAKTNVVDPSGFDAHFQNFCLGVSSLCLLLSHACHVLKSCEPSLLGCGVWLTKAFILMQISMLCEDRGNASSVWGRGRGRGRGREEEEE